MKAYTIKRGWLKISNKYNHRKIIQYFEAINCTILTISFSIQKYPLKVLNSVIYLKIPHVIQNSIQFPNCCGWPSSLEM